MQNGCRFQAVDLRWGVREEAGLDQQTMKICLGEIERCQKTTPRPNFLVLLGDRYGWRPLPPDIPADEFEQILKVAAGAEETSLLQRWNLREDNAIPPVYCLQPRRIESEDGAGDEERRQAANEEARQWDEVEGRLRRDPGERDRETGSSGRPNHEVLGLGHRAGNRSRGHEDRRRRKARFLFFP